MNPSRPSHLHSLGRDPDEDEAHQAPQRLGRAELKDLIDELRICARDVSAIDDMNTCGKLRRIAHKLEKGLLS